VEKIIHQSTGTKNHHDLVGGGKATDEELNRGQDKQTVTTTPSEESPLGAKQMLLESGATRPEEDLRERERTLSKLL